MWRIATPDELGRALEAGAIVKADLATAPTVTEPVTGTYVAVHMPPSAFVSVSPVIPSVTIVSIAWNTVLQVPSARISW